MRDNFKNAGLPRFNDELYMLAILQMGVLINFLFGFLRELHE